MSYSVGEVSRAAGVTVRTLHHYDKIDLLRPSERNAAGYRQYDEQDLERNACKRWPEPSMTPCRHKRKDAP